MTPRPELVGELPDVDLDAAGRLPVVRADEEDLHRGSTGVAGTAAVEAASGHAGWNMCQSVGLAAIARSKRSAISRESAATSSRITPVRSNSSGSPIRTSHPSSRV